MPVTVSPVSALFAVAAVTVAAGAAMAQVPGDRIGYAAIGQPTVAAKTHATRCAGANAQFNYAKVGTVYQYGPQGIAIDPRGRIFVTDFGGRRVLTWPNVEALETCAEADAVIGAGDLLSPSAVAVDPRNGDVFVADTRTHTVKGYRRVGAAWTRFVMLGTANTAGNTATTLRSPRGLAVGPTGRLFVADSGNNKVRIFEAPFANGEAAVDSLSAGANGGFLNPMGVAMVGDTLFVADTGKNRVLRFTGPFLKTTPVNVATASFTGLSGPTDVAVHPDGSLLVSDPGNRRMARYTDAAFGPSRTKPSVVFGDEVGPTAAGIAADPSGNVYLADYRRYRVLIRKEVPRSAPIAADTTPATKALLANLHARRGLAVNRVAIGQQLISYEYGAKTDPNAWYGDWLQMTNAGLPLPKVMGAELSDLMSYPGFFPNQNALDGLIAHGQAGNIVTLVWHPSHPIEGADFGTPTATANLAAMIDDSTAIGRAWQVQLDRAAAVLQKFETAGVPVMFRPLHEQNGDFFWWGDNGKFGAERSARQAAWAAVWRDMVTELTVRKGLSNLLFVFGTNQVNYGGVAAPMTYYPGGAWVDAVSIDLYDEELDMAGNDRGLQHYAALVGTGKPFGISEFGQSFGNGTGAGANAWDSRTLASRIRDSYPRTVFATAWYSSGPVGQPSSYVFALPDVAQTATLLADPLIDTQ